VTQPNTPSYDPTLAIAERQLGILAELSDLGMEAARAFTTSAVASAKAAETILEQEYFMPEVGRARACGAKDAAESFQKVSRSIRLTLMLEMNVGEIARDIRAGVVTYIGGIAHRKTDGAETGAAAEARRLIGPSDGVFTGLADDRDTDLRSRDSNTERLYDYERPDRLPRAPLRETVEQICDDLGATVDWNRWTLHPGARRDETLPFPPPPDQAQPPPGSSSDAPSPPSPLQDREVVGP
jgi:hypothetical protein